MDAYTRRMLICTGFNTNRFLKHLCGLNKGQLNAEDLRKAEELARSPMQEPLAE